MLIITKHIKSTYARHPKEGEHNCCRNEGQLKIEGRSEEKTLEKIAKGLTHPLERSAAVL
jgi:hypothetical protein